MKLKTSGNFPKAFIEDSSVAAVLAMHYTLQTAKAKDKTGLMRVLPILANSVKGHPFEDPFMHCLVTSLIQVGWKGVFFRSMLSSSKSARLHF